MKWVFVVALFLGAAEAFRAYRRIRLANQREEDNLTHFLGAFKAPEVCNRHGNQVGGVQPPSQ